MLASHPKIRKISFTGSVPTGKKIQQLAAGNLKHVTLELGGKSPAVVFEDADLEKALHVCGDAFLFNSSQACVATSRAFVHEKIAPQFLEGMKKRFGELQSAFGNPMEAGTQYGPLADRLQFDRVQGYIDVGKKEAELIAGGDTIGKTGLFIQPTIFLNPSDDARIYREEIFGPVLTIRTFQTEEEAIKLANDTVYGLSCSYICLQCLSCAPANLCNSRRPDRIYRPRASCGAQDRGRGRVDQWYAWRVCRDEYGRLQGERDRTGAWAAGHHGLFAEQVYLHQHWRGAGKFHMRRLYSAV